MTLVFWKRVSCCLVIAANTIFAGCHSIDIQNPRIAAAIDNPDASRTITVYLVARRGAGFVPTYSDRIIIAEPLITTTITRAQAKTIVRGIDTRIVGDSCDELRRRYTDLHECNEVDSEQREYGRVEATASTDSEGFATLQLGAGDYRMSLQTWVTAEDQKCSWSGSGILSGGARSLELPMLVFCE